MICLTLRRSVLLVSICLTILFLFAPGCGQQEVPKSSAPAGVEKKEPKNSAQQTPAPTSNRSTDDSADKKESTASERSVPPQSSEIKNTNGQKNDLAKISDPIAKPNSLKKQNETSLSGSVNSGNKTNDPKRAPISAKPIESKLLTDVKSNAAVALSDPQKGDAQKALDALKDLQIAIDKFLVATDLSFENLSASFETLRKICQSNGLKLQLDFSPFFERSASSFKIVEKSPFNWSFVIANKKGPQEKRDCLLFDASGKTPKITVTDDGKWKIAETGLFLMSYLNWTLVDGTGKTIARTSHPFLKQQNYNSSVYFPAGDTPHFLVMIFYRELVLDGGTKLFNGSEFYMHPQNLKRVVLPVYAYYDAEKKKLEKQRGSKFESSSVSSKPSPNSTPIGNVIYGRFVDKFFEGFHLNDKNDVGFDIYIENSDKQQLLLYHGTP